MATLDDDDDFVPRRRTQLMGPAAQAKALAEATARLAARRQRDALPHRIETPRLVLRAPIRGDVPELVKLADNKAIADRLTRLPHPYTRADGIGFVEIIAQRPDERPYAITLDDQFIGVVGFHLVVGELPEIGYWLGEPYWGRGIMSEAVKGLTEAAFATHLFPRIKGRALASNAGSLNVMQKAGFVRVGEGPDPAGRDRPTVYLELEQPKWS
ncbi:MAG TPA: GNAT family N-acetyltransferase [Devosia sp.]|jgi:RimJ/RimL family protein N-acetyltransferase|uniref:GNAT family N-acetyltransferase n=1 Tax=Devosia sp. TaxID=1871048 RepID=UPI002DDD9BBB|nr:GNAT family N-acetyltransferase [Devosia sp.]HEV2518852.1 GNAT family N-acetyltransferase [Devosia sp.]